MLKRFAEGVKWNLVGRSAALCSSMVVAICLARMLGPSSYGEFTLLLSTIGVCQLLCSLGLDTTLMRWVGDFRGKALPDEINNFVYAAIFLRASAVGLTLLLAQPVKWLLSLLVPALSHTQLPSMLTLALLLIAVSMGGLCKASLEAVLQQEYLNKALSAQALLRVTIIPATVHAVPTVTAALFAYSIAEWALFIALLLRLTVLVKPTFPSFARLPAVLRRYSLAVWFTQFGDQLIGKNPDILILAAFTSSAVVGYYSLAYTITERIFGTFAMLLGNMPLLAAAELFARGERQQLERLTKHLLKLYLLLIAPTLTGVTILAHELVYYACGPQYNPAVTLLRWFCVAYAVNATFGHTFGPILYSLGDARPLAAIQGLGIINLLVNLVLIPQYGAYGALAGTATTNVLIGAYTVFATRRHVRVEIPFRLILQLTASVGSMALIIWILKSQIASLFGTSIVMLCGVITYIIVARVLGSISKDDVDLLERSRMPGWGMLRGALCLGRQTTTVAAK